MTGQASQKFHSLNPGCHDDVITRIDDKDDSVDGERRFGDVGRYDDLASDGAVRLSARRRFEDSLLQIWRESRVEGDALHVAHLRTQVVDFAFDSLAAQKIRTVNLKKL